jgi:hypothetical protein
MPRTANPCGGVSSGAVRAVSRRSSTASCHAAGDAEGARDSAGAWDAAAIRAALGTNDRKMRGARSGTNPATERPEDETGTDPKTETVRRGTVNRVTIVTNGIRLK